jgi:hypothetical protein
MSIKRTLCPCSAKAQPSEQLRVVFPVPPFKLKKAIEFIKVILSFPEKTFYRPQASENARQSKTPNFNKTEKL